MSIDLHTTHAHARFTSALQHVVDRSQRELVPTAPEEAIRKADAVFIAGAGATNTNAHTCAMTTEAVTQVLRLTPWKEAAIFAIITRFLCAQAHSKKVYR